MENFSRTRGRPRKNRGRVGRPRNLHNTLSGYAYAPLRPSRFGGMMRPRRVCAPSRRQLGNESKCSCVAICGEECLNKLARLECNLQVCSVLCGTVTDCGNRPFKHVRDTPKQLRVCSLGDKGNGLITERKLHKGEIVTEYIGKTIALGSQEDYGGNAYLMWLDDHHVIDAEYSGHVSRFINHSCEPNLECIKWRVDDQDRIGFFAIKDIKAGIELTFDYAFTAGGFRCLCNSKNCRGWVGASSANV